MMFSIVSFSQDIIKHEKTTFRGDDGKLYWNKDLPVYINVSTDPDSKGHNLESEHHAKYTNPFYFDTEGANFIRSNWAVDKETRKTIEPKITLMFEVYADGKAPHTKAKFSGTGTYKSKNKYYYGKGLKLSLSSSDEVSGVNKIYYSLDNEPYKEYTGEIEINVEYGKHVLKYYAIDNVGNIEDVESNTKTFYTDSGDPQTFHNVTGINLDENVIALNTKIYLTASDEGIGLKQTYYKFDEGPYIPYDGNAIPIKQLSEDHHTITYYSVDNVGNKENEKSFTFFLDKSAPILTSDVLGDRFIVNDQIYFSGRTKMKLTAVDNKSGVKEVNFSIDESEFNTYSEPFYLPQKPGFHVVKFYAVDNADNVTGGGAGSGYKKYMYTTKKIYVDLTGPDLNHSITGKYFTTRDTMFLGKHSKIKLTAKDPESGLQYISYSIDGVQEETVYTEPFTVEGDGEHLIEYFGYDNVNNRNINSFYVVVDQEAPEAHHMFSIQPIGIKEGLHVYPNYVLVYLSGIDKKTGNDRIFWSLNDGLERLYASPVKGFKTGKNKLTYKVVDKLENEKYSEIEFFIE
jgi:hypothetical protein